MTTNNMDSLYISSLDEAIDVEGTAVLDIQESKIIKTSQYENTVTKHNSTTGTLANGRKYFIYRFVLFWDGFRVSEVGSKTVDGIYIIPLNLPSRYRSSSSAIRVVSLVPKSVPPGVVLEEILTDIRAGMTEGFIDYDANGEKVTIFLDLVACIGDTPAINEVLDVRGHSAVACYHLCRFRRLGLQVDLILGQDHDRLFKPRYMGTDIHGGKAFASRSFLSHSALQDYTLDEGTKKRLGIQIGQDLPFNQYQKEFAAISNKIPFTDEGIPVVPSSFHCYRGLLIGPDHLLFGLAKNCLTAVLKLLPDEKYIITYEKVPISLLSQARMSKQNKIVDTKNKSLLTMSISQVFALLLVSEYSFYITISQLEGLPIMKDSRNVSNICIEAIKLVQSLTSIAARLWFQPRLEEDGIESVKRFNSNYGTSYLRETQLMIERHIRDMRAICTYKNDDLRQCNILKKKTGRSAKDKRKIVEARIQDAITSTKALDRPNVHRLLELAHVHLPMVGSATRITDLEFERGHQSLKRVLEKSNNREAHIQAVSGAVYNGWQGRLTTLLRYDLVDNESPQRYLFRLLFGREAVSSREGKLSPADSALALEAISPTVVVQRLFQMQGRTVINDSVGSSGTSFWTGEMSASQFHPSHVLHGHQPYVYDLNLSTDEENSISTKQKYLMNRAKDLVDSVYGSGKWGFSDRVYPTHHGSNNRKPQIELRPGDVLQCIGVPSSVWVPIIVPYSLHMSPSHATSRNYYILFLFIIEGKCGAAVLPCEQIPDPYHEGNRSDSTSSERRLHIPNSIPHKIQCEIQEVKVMTLTNSCQRLLVEHQCTMNCKLSEERSETVIRHSEHPLEACIYLINRENGFPARAA